MAGGGASGLYAPRRTPRHPAAAGQVTRRRQLRVAHVAAPLAGPEHPHHRRRPGGHRGRKSLAGPARAPGPEPGVGGRQHILAQCPNRTGATWPSGSTAVRAKSAAGTCAPQYPKTWSAEPSAGRWAGPAHQQGALCIPPPDSRNYSPATDPSKAGAGAAAASTTHAPNPLGAASKPRQLSKTSRGQGRNQPPHRLRQCTAPPCQATVPPTTSKPTCKPRPGTV